MSRDHLIPAGFSRLTQRNIPVYGITVTVGLIILLVLYFDIASIVKLASAFQLLMFALICSAVIVMRERKLRHMIRGSVRLFIRGCKFLEYLPHCG
ncbi:MAG: hypothetical protein CM1200mP28_14680 [Deltaproteobacteria bacterium]|nr:MAG: hypothetical protein CM1200mP28_14680 [Deltaproteobacteria bacterium]